MKTKVIIFALSLFTLQLISCKKAKEDPSKYELISKKIWNWDQVKTYEDNVLKSVKDKDGYKIEFKEDHRFIVYKPDGSIDAEAEWDINKDETKFYLLSKNAAQFDIDKLTENEFVFSYTETEEVSPIVQKLYVKPDYHITKTIFYLSR